MKRLIGALAIIAIFISGCSTTPEQRVETVKEKFPEAKVVTESNAGMTTNFVLREGSAVMCVSVWGDGNKINTKVNRKIDFSQSEYIDRAKYEKEIIDQCK